MNPAAAFITGVLTTAVLGMVSVWIVDAIERGRDA